MGKKEDFLFGDRFTEYIMTMIPNARLASGGKEIVCKCKYCMDSLDPTHGHMYIKVPQDKSDAPVFHCFKCQTAGVLDSRTLIEWGIYDPVIGTEIDKINKTAAKSKKNVGYNRDWYQLFNHVDDYNLAHKKLNYINQRLGTDLSIETCLKEKIIFNLEDVLRYNKIDTFTRNPNIIHQINDNFVGFLSLDNNFINFRRICEEGIVYESIDKRYINYNIHGKLDNTEKMYVLPATIDLTNPYPVDIHIAEGPFDILSIKYNLRGCSNGIYAAITGSGYKGLVKHIITNFEIFNFTLHMYPDNDALGDLRAMEEIYNMIKPYSAQMYIHRNEGEKDFGVPMDRIHEQIYMLNNGGLFRVK